MKRITVGEMFDWSETQSSYIRDNIVYDEYDDPDEMDVDLYEGDYQTDTLVLNPCVVVEGNLTVNNITWKCDCGLLVVTGDLRCKNFSYPYTTVVGGNIYADDISVNSGCDYGLYVGKNIYAGSVIEKGHSIKVKGRIHASVIRSEMNRIEHGWSILNLFRK